MYKPTSEIIMEAIKNKNNCNYKDKETLHWDDEVLKQNLKVPPIQNSQYTYAQFAKLISDTTQQIYELSKNKGEEYAGHGNDWLATFRDLSKDLNMPMEVVWAVYTKKHWNAIMTYINDIRSGTKSTRLEPISGRLDDLIVYCILFKAMIEDRENQK